MPQPSPPYGVIADLLRAGKVVPFLGAGAALGSRAPGQVWQQGGHDFLPTGAELARYLADWSSFPSTDERDVTDLAKVASYVVQTSARGPLRGQLREVFLREYEPCAIHHYLASIGKPLLIVTTNYDDLAERALAAAGRPYDLVIHPTDRRDIEASVLWWRHGAAEPEAVHPNQLAIDLQATTVVYKMHGTVDRLLARRDSFVVTEEDYVDFLWRMTANLAVPACFMRYFRTRHFLFLGYGLRDWNFRLLLRNLEVVLPTGRPGDAVATDGEDEEEEERRSWAIQIAPADLERQLWSARRVNIYDQDINLFVERLRARGS
jgi:hypothetical protein